MSKQVQVTLDEYSIGLLSSVDAIHRDSLINLGISMISKTGYYKTLTGKNDTEDLEDVVSLDGLEAKPKEPKETNKEPEQEKPKKAVSNWDSF